MKIWGLAGLLLASCSAVPTLSIDGGVSSSSGSTGTGTTTGTGSSGSATGTTISGTTGGATSNQVSGPLGFDAQGASDYVFDVDGGGVSYVNLSIYDVSTSIACSGPGRVPLPPYSVVEIVLLNQNGVPLAPGGFDVPQVGLTLEHFLDGGTVEALNATSGSILFSELSHANASGTFSVQLGLSDGGLSPISGAFSAQPCP